MKAMKKPSAVVLASVGLEGLGQVLQQREQLLLLQRGAVGPGQQQVGGRHPPVCTHSLI